MAPDDTKSAVKITEPVGLADKDKFVSEWQYGLHIRHAAHNRCFSFYKKLDRIVGLSATILSALVSTAVIVSFTNPAT